MHIWHLSHSKDGYAITLNEEKWLPHHAEIWWDKFLTVIDHPCCGYRYESGKPTIWARISKILPKTQHDRDMENFTDEQWKNHNLGPHSPLEFIDWLGWNCMNNKITNWNHRVSRQILSIPITHDQAVLVDPEWVKECDDIFSDDEDLTKADS
jgi:hypothetical protein